MKNISIKRALISVADKTNLIPFVEALRKFNVDIISTGGTAKMLRDNNIPVTDVSDYTGFPEIMGGRVKTLHPKIYGALLGRIVYDSELMTKHGILLIDLVVVNLYPFAKTISKPDITVDDAIENIDIGGPTMLRAAAKNHQRIMAICDISDYDLVLEELEKTQGETTFETRSFLAQKVFAHTANYDALIANYFLQQSSELKTEDIHNPNFTKIFNLRYGENPHQKAAFYKDENSTENNITNAKKIQGKEMSFNNIADADAALECVRNFDNDHACVIVKHANPCGVALASDQKSAYERAFATDTTSAFGGIISFNKPLVEETAQTILNNQFVEVIISPAVNKDVLEILKQKPNIRLLECGDISSSSKTGFDYKKVNGGLLVQDRDVINYFDENLKVVTQQQPSEQQWQDLKFAWTIAKYVKSNAIVYAKDNATIGIGAGQMSRVDSTKIATLKAQEAGLSITGSVMASDAFFPFRDAIDAAAEAGIEAIIQPGGSIRDEEVIASADEHRITMVFTGIRHFRH